MHVPPSITAVQAALLAASQNAIHASYVAVAGQVVEALENTRAHIIAATHVLEGLCPTEPHACAVAQAISGLRTTLDGALLVAASLDPVDGHLPVGTVDPVFDGLEDATRVLFASRWG
jgi:hypothetical protein